MKCSLCKQEGHNKSNKKFHPPKNLNVKTNAEETPVKTKAEETPVEMKAEETPVKTKAEETTQVSMLLPMDKRERVKRLKEHLALTVVKHEDQIMKLSTLKEAHAYCVIHCISSQQYGSLLEKFIRTKFNYIKNKAEDCIGDCFKDGKNSEIKVSLGGKTHIKFNFVQIRPYHDCDTYILTAFHLCNDNVESEGELYIFRVPKEDIKHIIVSYGGYAHGTIQKHGSITIDSLNEKENFKEYCLRPMVNDDCWKTLSSYRILESDL